MIDPSHLPIRSVAIAAFLSFGGISPQASASLLASDDFSSYAAPSNLLGKNGGTGWSGGYLVGAPSEGYLNEVRNGAPLAYPNYVANGGNFANLASGYGGPSFNYFQRDVDLAGAFSSYSDGTRVGLDGTSLWGSFLYNKVNAMEFWLQGAANIPLPLPSNGSDSLYLFHIQYGAGNVDTITIWNNPDLSTWTPAATPTFTFTSDYSFKTLVFVAPNSTNEGRVDNIRLGSNAIDVVPYTSTSTAFQTWAVSKGLDPLTDGAPGFDKDGDGATNLQEYAFFTDPNSSGSAPSLITATDSTNLTLTYQRAVAATDVTYSAESSTDLVNWSTLGLTDAATGNTTTDTIEYRATAARSGDPAKFLRIHVTLTP